VDDVLRALAEPQHAAISRVQVRGVGASSNAIDHRLGTADWEAATARVLRLVGAPRTPQQDLMVAVLDAGPGCVASYRAAAALWRLPGFPLGPLEVSRPRGWSGRRPARARLHETRYLPATHVTEVNGIPVTTLPRTLFDLAGVQKPTRMERLVNTVAARSPAVLSGLHEMLDELAEHGRNGIVLMREILERLPVGCIPPTGLEERFSALLEEAGEPPLDRQIDLGGHSWIGRVDFVDRALGLVVEVDSATYHSSPLDREADARRDVELLAAGWKRVERIAEEQIWYRPWEPPAIVRRARAALREAFVSRNPPSGVDSC